MWWYKFCFVFHQKSRVLRNNKVTILYENPVVILPLFPLHEFNNLTKEIDDFFFGNSLYYDYHFTTLHQEFSISSSKIHYFLHVCLLHLFLTSTYNSGVCFKFNFDKSRIHEFHYKNLWFYFKNIIFLIQSLTV